jgi:hypothetical protein
MAVNKKAGKKSLAQNDHLFPAAPLIGTATDVGASRAFNNGAATVTFTAQGPNAATSFTATSSPGGFFASAASSPITVEGLQSNVAYTFTVTGTNDGGTGPASSASGSITATTVPATPAAPTATSPSAGVDRVTWTAPENGGKAITNYFWSSSDGKSGSTTSTTVDVSQEQGTAQTYTVRADNANGNSSTSAASGSVTTTFSFAPFGFAPFGFAPFGAFGFSPFGFSPFFAFGFSPFGFAPSRYSSDKRIKENVEDLSIGLDLVKRLNPKKYSYTSSPDVVEHGLMAQELRATLEELGISKNLNLVIEDNSPESLKMLPEGESGPVLGIYYDKLIPALINSIKELSLRLEDLEKKYNK